MKSPARLLIALTLLAASNAALAHTGHGMHGFGAGFAHPFTGVDHLLAMFAVGLWAAQMQPTSRPRATWWLPLSFMLALVPGAMWAVMGGPFALTETGIAASVLALGLVIALAVRLPVTLSVALTLLFGLFHGYAHGAEMPLSVTPLAYGVGFLLATGMLHVSGVALGINARLGYARAIQVLGAVIASAGVWMLI
jgi:urease accessory protein